MANFYNSKSKIKLAQRTDLNGSARKQAWAGWQDQVGLTQRNMNRKARWEDIAMWTSVHRSTEETVTVIDQYRAS